MEILGNILKYIFSFESYVLLPVIIFIFSLLFRISPKKAFKASLTMGIGFIGIFMVLDYFVVNIGPAVEALTAHTGLEYNVLDIGWPTLAAITWSFNLAPILIFLIIGVNIAMFALKKTRTVNVDIWNYWHFIFMARMVYEITGNILLTIISALLLSIIALKLADWSTRRVEEYTGLSGISITTISTIVYYPIALVMDKLLDKIELINKVDADPEYLKKKLGLLGEPMVIGFLIGILLGFGAEYDLKELLGLAFSISAVIYLLPLMAEVLSKGLLEVTEGIKVFVKEKFFARKEIYIGLDLAILLGNPAIVVTGVFLMPVALILAFIIPGVNFIPLGDLGNLIGAASIVVIAMRGNIFRSIMTFIPIVIGKLLIASRLAPLFTQLAVKGNIRFEGYNGVITGFLDGGNLLRYWVLELFSGKLWPFLLLPVIIYLFLFARKESSANLFKKRR